jgi:hypothetical protein
MFLGIDYTTTASGAVLKFVQCEDCGKGYAYWMSRRIRASQFSPLALTNRGSAEGARTKAEDRLRESLKNSCDPVPCPHCGKYQEAMVLRLRRIRFKWVTKFCIGLFLASLWIVLFLAGLHMVPEEHLGEAIAVILVATWGPIPILLLGRYLLNRKYDPSRSPVETRLKLGDRLALSDREYALAIEELKRRR